MYINISPSGKGDNRDSSAVLVNYLEKENRLYPEQQERWFNGQDRDIRPYQVRSALDGNVAKLCQKDAKFFLVNISPSQWEIGFLLAEFGEKGAREQLKAYAAKVMDAYALNFHKEKVSSNLDLLWFGKVEQHRYYSNRDKSVQEGLAAKGTLKPGAQLHVQVIVSRKDSSNSIRLSPMNTSRGRNSAHSAKMGQFDRAAFKQVGEKLFDEYFGFQRKLEETFVHANAKAKREAGLDRCPMQQKEEELLIAAGTGLLDILLEKQGADPLAPELKRRQRKKRKGRGGAQQLER